jgi:uncharacterized protein (DUF427 family)
MREAFDQLQISPREGTDSARQRASCPYKGTVGRYWNAVVGDTVLADVVWSYDFPTQQVQPIAGLVAFDDTAVEVIVEDGSRGTEFATRS